MWHSFCLWIKWDIHTKKIKGILFDHIMASQASCRLRSNEFEKLKSQRLVERTWQLAVTLV